MTLDGVHPGLVDKVTKILTAMSTLGFPMQVTQAVRSVKTQQNLYAQGRTLPGKIVTNADGIIHKSNHQPQADGFGHAVDMAFAGPDPFAESHPWELYGAMVESLDLVWGGKFHALRDRPHAEMT